MTDQPDLLTWKPPEPADVKGETYSPERDGKRLNRQTLAVFNCIKDGEWWLLRGLSQHTNSPEASVSARLRDLRRFGFTIQREHVKDGLHRYRMVKP